MNSKVKLAILLAIATLVIGGQLLHRATQEAPTRHTGDEESQVGQRLATLADARTPDGGVVTVVVLFRQGIAPYQTRIDALAEQLSESATVHLIWAVDEKIYNDDDYTATLDAALQRQPDTQTLVVVGGGGVTHASVSTSMQAFLDGGGELLLNGATSEESAFVELAKRGKVTILARRTTWLRPADPAVLEAVDVAYVDRHYVMLPSDG